MIKREEMLNLLQVTCDCKKLLEVTSESGASNWFNAIPLKKYGFHLEKNKPSEMVFI